MKETAKKLLWMIFVFVSLYGCAGKAFKHAAQIHTIEAYETFLSIYQEGEFAQKAQERIEVLTFGNAAMRDTVEAYEEFLDKYPEGKHHVRAKERIEELYYVETKSKHNIEAFRAFLGEFPESKYAPEIRYKLIASEVLEVAIADHHYILPGDIGQGEKLTEVTLLNRTGIPIEALILSKDAFRLMIKPDEKKVISVIGNSIVVFKDRKRTVKSCSYLISYYEEKINNLQIWISQKNNNSKKIEVIREK